MSHRVTTSTEMRDRALIEQACKQTGVSFVANGSNAIRFTSGSLNNAVLNLSTGTIEGDTDYGHTSEKLGALKQAYGEAKYRYECTRQGIMIESRSVDARGNIVLMCGMG